MKKLTVFTPTYNRAYLLPQLYKSLVCQTNKEFIWLIIDDGSNDNTKEIVKNWQQENKISIQYIYQENQGMHGAHNTAYKNIDTELNTCIDSDDYMPNDAVEIILTFWKNNYNDNKIIAGFVALDADKKGNIIGTKIPEKITQATLHDLYHKHHIKGDKKLVYRTEVVKTQSKYPLFDGENFVPLGTLYLMIDQEYKLLTLNKILCIVEYMPDGSSLNIFKQYKKNPKGFRYARKIELLYIKSFKMSVIKILHLISSTIFIGDYNFFKNNPKKTLTFLLFPFGLVFHLFILLKLKK